jgi:heterotetrameric sarcosine oxidase gamma subunit
VSLKAPAAAADMVAERLSLCPPLQIDHGDPGSLWVAPGCWLLLSSDRDAGSIIERCDRDLGEQLHVAVDMSDGLSTFNVEGAGARELLSSACGLDLRTDHFTVGACHRTRFAQVPVFVARRGDDRFELMVERSYARYLSEWLNDSSCIVEKISRQRSPT